jgi:precorrin-2 dehydrogenase/sirohydrochlorin ferrochelatase
MRIPMFVDIDGMNVLVLGGGDEAVKKTKRFLKYGARMTIYSLEFDDELLRLSKEGAVRLVKGDVRDRQTLERIIQANDMVIYTVPDMPEAEDWVIDVCRKGRKLYIIATDAKKTQIAMPVETVGAGLRIAVTSEGRSTLVAKLVAEEINSYLKGRKDLELFLDVMTFLKEYMKENKVHYKSRMELYRKLFADKKLRELVSRLDRQKALAYIVDVVDGHVRERASR